MHKKKRPVELASTDEIQPAVKGRHFKSYSFQIEKK